MDLQQKTSPRQAVSSPTTESSKGGAGGLGNQALAARLSATSDGVGGAGDSVEAEADALADDVLQWVGHADSDLGVSESDPLPAGFADAFQALAGFDVRAVKVRSGASAAADAGAVGAEAYAQGNEVVVPDAGDAGLLAHELAHVALQHVGTGLPMRRKATNPGDSGTGVGGTLRYGDKGAAVEALQTSLVSLGYLTAADMATGPGIYGRRTQAAVMAFQGDAGQRVDGIAGAATLGAIQAALAARAPAGGGGGETATTTATLTGKPQLQRGAKGEQVKILQTLLNARGAKLVVDGDFGRITERAVRAFQQANGLVVDGAVGPKTAAKLSGAVAPAPTQGPVADPGGGRQQGAITGNPTLKQGMEGVLVKELQKQLNKFKAGVLVDGEFGPVTRRAVEGFQRANGMKVDGEVGPKTAAALYNVASKPIEKAPTGGNAELPTGTVDVDVDDADPKGLLADSKINPTVRKLASETITTMQGRGYSPYVVGGFRSFEYQDNLYAQGRTKPGSKVTYVKGGGSWHNYGLAVDIVFWNKSHTGPSWDGGHPWQELGRVGKSKGFTRWMGDEGWDFPHFEHHPKWGNGCYDLASTMKSQGLSAVWKKVM